MRLRTRSIFPAILFLIAVLVSSCAHGPKPRIEDKANFQEVNIGPIQYVIRDGVAVSRKGPGFVEHTVERLPGVTIRVEYDSSPQINLKRDGDIAERRFLREIARSTRLRSTQYDVVDDKEVLKCFVEGITDKNEHVYGSMMMLRAKDETARITVKGPFALRNEIERAMNRIAENITINNK